MPSRRFNDKLLLQTLGLLALIGFSVHLVHGIQVRCHAETFRDEAQQAELEGQLARAASYLARYLDLAPQDTEALAHYGVLLEQTATTVNGQRRALAVFRQVLAREPARRDQRRRFVSVAGRLGDATELRKHIEVLLQIEPDQASFEILLGQCLEAEGDWDGALRIYEQAIVHAPGLAEPYTRLGAVLARPDQATGASE